MVWICKSAAYVPGRGIVRPGARVEFADSEVDDRIRRLFDPETPKDKAESEEKEAEEKDMAFRAKVERLKAMKVKLPPRVNREQVDALFKEHCEKVDLPEIRR